MRTAAQLFQSQQEGAWIDELERLAEQIDELPPTARLAIQATVDSFLQESGGADADRVQRLLAGFS